MILGLKSSTDIVQIQDRLKYHPDVFEFHLTQNDMTNDGLKRLSEYIDMIKDKYTQKIILHEPIRYNGFQMEMIMPENFDYNVYNFMMNSIEKIIKLSIDKNIYSLIHGAFNKETQKYINMYKNFSDAEDTLINRLDYFNKYSDGHLCIENSISSLWGYSDPKVRYIAKKHQYKLAFDTSHAFIQAKGSNKILIESLKDLHDNIVHYHLVDSNGLFHDSLEIGKGKIDWGKVIPVLNLNATLIYEINLKNQEDAKEQINSYHYLLNLLSK